MPPPEWPHGQETFVQCLRAATRNARQRLPRLSPCPLMNRSVAAPEVSSTAHAEDGPFDNMTSSRRSIRERRNKGTRQRLLAPFFKMVGRESLCRGCLDKLAPQRHPTHVSRRRVWNGRRVPYPLNPTRPFKRAAPVLRQSHSSVTAVERGEGHAEW